MYIYLGPWQMVIYSFVFNILFIQGDVDDFDIEEEIICSQDSVPDSSIKNNKCIIESAKFNKLLGPSCIFQDKGKI